MKVSKVLPEKTENEKVGYSAVKWFQEFTTLGGITQVIFKKKWPQDIQHNDIPHNDTQDNDS
jgi:hypothetical protein